MGIGPVQIPHSPWALPIPQNSLDQGKRRDRSSVRTQNTRPQGNPHHLWSLKQCRPLLLGKPAFRADQDRKRLVRIPTHGDKRGHRVAHLGILIAKYQ